MLISLLLRSRPMPNRPRIDGIKIHEGHMKAKVNQRRKNFIDKFEAALNEISLARHDLKQLSADLEPNQTAVIDQRLNQARLHIEYIWRESGLKK